MIKILEVQVNKHIIEGVPNESLTIFAEIDGQGVITVSPNVNATRDELIQEIDADRDRLLARGWYIAESKPDLASNPPQSMHIAALTAVDTSTKKGTVVRKWMGQNYTYDNCYVSLQALEAYQAGKIKLFNPAYGILAPENADSFVLVYFVSENPYDESLEIPVIVDKLVK